MSDHRATRADPAGTPGPVRTYEPALDGLRAVAVAMVMLLHTSHRLGAPSGGIDLWIHGALGAGWVGVDLFFVLSGFLITGILVAAKTTKPDRYFRTFYARRALRKTPPRCSATSRKSKLSMLRIVGSQICNGRIARVTFP